MARAISLRQFYSLSERLCAAIGGPFCACTSSVSICLAKELSGRRHHLVSNASLLLDSESYREGNYIVKVQSFKPYNLLPCIRHKSVQLFPLAMAPAVKASWIEITQRKGAPKARSSHSLAVIGRKAYTFGGEFEPRVPIDNDMHVFDLDTKQWSIAKAVGDVPAPRIGVAMVALGSVLYVFAGRDNGHEELDEFFSFNTATGEWQKLPPGPPHRSYHTLVADEERKQLYTFGGCGVNGRLNDLWAFDTASNQWEAFPSPPPGSACCPRGGPGLAVAGGAVWVIFGFNGKELGDVHRFDLEKRMWEEVSVSGSAKPIARSVFGVVTVNSRMVLYGGEVDPSDLGHLGAGAFSDEVWVLDPELREWIKPDVVLEGASHPGGRGWYSAAPVGANQMLVYGGNSATNDRLDDMYLLTVSV